MPLAGILGFTEILRREPLEVRARTVLERIATASRSLQSLLGDILEFSRMEQDTLILHEEPIDLRALIDQIERESAGTAEAKGLTLSVDIAPDVPTRVVTDPLRVRQVLINLISNAIRYTKRGQVMVTVSKVVAQADGSGNRLEISVKDTGPGIPDHQRDVIFDAFVQADDRHFQTGRTESGAGLGLAIVRKVVDVLGGDLRLESAVGFGSEFIVTLPYRHAAATETLSPTYGEVPAKIRQKFGRILLADDVEMNRDLFADLLSGISDEVIVVADGQQALSMLSVEAFDVAVIDVQMPVMDGLDFVRAVRMSENPKIRTLPIVGLSAAAFAEDRARALEAGMDSYVTKPASQDSLVRGLVTAMAQRAEPMELSDRSSEAAAPSSDRAFDQTFFERQTNVLGPENVRAYLKKLTVELTARKQALHDARAIDDRAAIARLAHAIASAGGNLGFAALYRAAQAVETVTSGDGGHSQAGVSKSLELLDAALDDALARIPDLLAQQTP